MFASKHMSICLLAFIQCVSVYYLLLNGDKECPPYNTKTNVTR